MRVTVKCKGGLLFDLEDYRMVRVVRAEGGYVLAAMNPMVVDEATGIPQQEALIFFPEDDLADAKKQAFNALDAIAKHLAGATGLPLDLTRYGVDPTPEVMDALGLTKPADEETPAQPTAPYVPPKWFRIRINGSIIADRASYQELAQIYGRRVIKVELSNDQIAILAGDPTEE